MPKFEGCVEAKEISLVSVKRGGGANQHAHVLIRKRAADPAADGNQVENTEMPTQAEITKAALAMTVAVAKMDDVTKSYWLALGEDAQTAFLEKSATDQKTEADTAKAAADRKVAEAEAAKSGKTVEFVALEKSNSELRAEVEALKAKNVESEIEKRADAEFAGYPGGSVAVVPLLKAYAKLDPEARTASEAVLKAQCQTASAMTKALGGRTEEQVSKADAAKSRIEKRAKELATEKSMSFDDAFIAVTELREFAEDVAQL